MSEISHARRTIRAVGWNAVGTGLRFALQFGTGIILARQLGPQAFGVVAAAMVVIALGALIGEAGLGASLIADEKPSPEDFASAQTLQLGMACLLALLLSVAAPLVAAAYGIPQLTTVLRVLSLQFPLQAVGTVGNVALKRRLDFRSLQLAQVGGYGLGYGFVGMAGMAIGWGVWSLVAAQLTFVAASSALLLARSGERPRLRFARPPRHILSYGLRVAASNLGTWVSTNLDVAVVGRLFGAVLTGLYSRSAALIAAPLNLLITLVQSVMFPAFAQARGRGTDLSVPYLGVCSAALIAGTGAAAFVSLHAADIVLLLLGREWAASAPMLALLAWTIPLQAVTSLSVALLWGMGKASADLQGQAVAFALFVIALAAGVAGTPVAVAAIVVGTSVVRAALTFALAARALAFPATRITQVLCTSAIVGGVVVLPPALRWFGVLAGPESAGSRLLLDGASVLLLIAPVTLAWPRAVLGRELAAVAHRVVGGLSSPALRLIFSRFPTR